MAKTQSKKTEPSPHRFTVCRQLVGDDEQLPDGLLFSSKSEIDDAFMEKIFKDQAVRDFMPKGKPMACFRYYSSRAGEHRVVATSLSYYNKLIQRDVLPLTVLYQEPGTPAAGNIPAVPACDMKRLDWKELLDGCMEVFSALNCEGCPHKGLECVNKNVGYRPWIFSMAYNLQVRGQWADGLTETGSVKEKTDKIRDHELQVPGVKDATGLFKHLEGTTLVGFSWVNPKDTQPDATRQSVACLRPPREHILFRESEPGNSK